MGYGDALLAAGMAQRLYDSDRTAGPVAICDDDWRLRWHPLWERNPVITATVAPTTRRIQCGRDTLPYLNHPWSMRQGWTFSDWRAADHRSKIYLTADERMLGAYVREAHGPFLILEPTGLRKHINRRPPTSFWHALAPMLQRSVPLTIVQLAYDCSDTLPGIPQIPHQSFRQACGILAASSMLVATEGGLAHAAAALNIPAVVLWGGNVSVQALGYPEHVNLVDDDPQTLCGVLQPCDHCAAVWARRTPESVVAAVQQLAPVRMGVSA